MLQLIDHLLSVDSEARPSINELLKFPILRHRVRQVMDDAVF